MWIRTRPGSSPRLIVARGLRVPGAHASIFLRLRAKRILAPMFASRMHASSTNAAPHAAVSAFGSIESAAKKMYIGMLGTPWKMFSCVEPGL